ncbi:NAD(P)/FAD-dependent oxidoreductase [Brevibacterium oceani]|uniref:NAD(P)/FAD-dependent oxidoreductase n=1 Tax=Brevibacterium oceani TaxID=358099 RepID=UPI001B31B22D|nr:FAD-binding oxidoreductase [Brevibacterium oceani]
MTTQLEQSVIVIGAGIIGVSLADALVKRGQSVKLLDFGEPAGGTSEVSYGWINSHRKHPIAYHRLNVEGLRRWQEIAQDDPQSVTFAGHVEFADDEEHRQTLTERVERLILLGYPAAWVDTSEAEKLTGLQVPASAIAAVFEAEGHAFPITRTSTLLDGLVKNDRFSMNKCRVTSVRETSDGVTVVTDQGEINGRAAVVAAGNGSEHLVESAGGRLPLVPAVVNGSAYGYLARVEAAGHPVQGLVTTDSLNLRPENGERLLVQALDLDSTADRNYAPSESVVEEFSARVSKLLPDLETQIVDIRVGHRVIPADGLPAVGRIHPSSSIFAAVTHSGIVLSPLLADILSEEILGAEPNDLLKTFQPSRFLDNMQRESFAAPRRPGEQ